ncbi:MAG: AAA family ATPase [Clostridia bacterium]|nr:AAA family ATPase [Clostridia bacterium]
MNLYLLSNPVLEFLGSGEALTIYIAALLILICIIAVQVLIALNIIGKKTGERGANLDTGNKGAGDGESRFNMLCAIDKEMKVYKEPEYDRISLEEFCYRFRDYSANELGLYYDIEDVRRFVAGLGVTRLVILQGMSGTGKTSLAYALGQFLENDSVIVPVQPMWKERSDLIGYFNEFTKRFNETTLLRKMYEAGYRRELYITVLDEVNISRIEYYFAEFLSLLELPDPEKRYLDVVSDVWYGDPIMLKDGKIKLPPNMWFVGTANNDDSTFAISDKVYDRAMILNLDKRCSPFEADYAEPVKISYEYWNELIDDAVASFSLSEAAMEKIKRLDGYLTEKYRITFGNRIMKQIEKYVPVMLACGGNENGAVDDILSKKVLRKLEHQNPGYIKSTADDLIAFIEELFGKGEMPLCIECIERLCRIM